MVLILLKFIHQDRNKENFNTKIVIPKFFQQKSNKNQEKIEISNINHLNEVSTANLPKSKYILKFKISLSIFYESINIPKNNNEILEELYTSLSNFLKYIE